MFRKLIDWLLGPWTSEVIESAPRVTPDPEAAAHLQRRSSDVGYTPEYGFLRDTPTCKRINLAEYRIERARRRARSAL